MTKTTAPNRYDELSAEHQHRIDRVINHLASTSGEDRDRQRLSLDVGYREAVTR